MVDKCLEALGLSLKAKGVLVIHQRRPGAHSPWSTIAKWPFNLGSEVIDAWERLDWSTQRRLETGVLSLPVPYSSDGTFVDAAPIERFGEPYGYVCFLRDQAVPPVDTQTVLAAARSISAVIGIEWEHRHFNEANSRLQAAVEAAGLGIWSYSFDKRRFEFGANFWASMGENAAQKSIDVYEAFALLTPEDGRTMLTEITKLAEGTESALDVTVRFRSQSGEIRWTRMRGRKQVGLDDDELGEIIGTMQDIHEQVSLDSLIVNTLEELADARIKMSEAAVSIQRDLLVKSPPRRIGDFQILSCSFPSQGADGDFFDVLPIEDGIIDVLVGDVMGKGITAALVGAGLKSQIARTFGLLAASGDTPKATAIMQAVNDRVGPQLIKLSTFVTLAYVRLDADEQTLELIDCGHTRTLVISPETGEYRFINGDHLPIGIIRGEVYRSTISPLNLGDVVLLYSDGLLDVEIDGVPLGESGLAEIIVRACQVKPVLESIASALQDLKARQVLKDDLTCLIVQLAGAGKRLFCRRRVASELEQIDAVREFVSESLVLLNSEIDFRSVCAFELAAVETFTNIVRHAHLGREGETVRIELAREETRHELRMRYQGEPFDPTVQPLSDTPDLMKISGWGLGIVHELSDSVEYDQDDRGTVCITIIVNIE